MNSNNKKLLIVLAVVVVIVGIVWSSIGGADSSRDIAMAGKAKYTYVGDKDCPDCQTSFAYVQQALSGQDVIVEFVDLETDRNKIPAVGGADNEGALVNTCEAGDHVTLMREGGTHFASVEEAAAALGVSGGQPPKLYIVYGSDGCADCQVVEQAFAKYSTQYSTDQVEFSTIDINAEAEAATAAGLTGAHMIVASDEDGCTGTRDGIPGANEAAILQVLQQLQIAPGGYVNQ